MSDREYYHIDVPEDTDPEDYEWWERRAEILDKVLAHGHPHDLEQVALAERYGVSQSQISQDMDRLREHVAKHLGHSAKMTTRAVYQKAIEQAQQQNDWREAFEIAMRWNEWLQDIGEQETVPDQHEISGELQTEHTEKKMLVGLDLQSFPEVDESRMVGVDVREDPTLEQAARSRETSENGEIEVADASSRDANPGGNGDSSEQTGGDE